MEADKTSFERIEGTAQANEPGLVKQTSPDPGNAAIWKFSCDGIWAVSARSSDLRSGSSPAESLQFSVGTGRRRSPGGKLGVSMVAVATAALLIVFPPLTPEARTQRATEVTMAAARGAAMPAGNVIGICDRTPAVRDRLLILLRQALTPAYRGDCAGVTDAWLARLTSVQLVVGRVGKDRRGAGARRCQGRRRRDLHAHPLPCLGRGASPGRRRPAPSRTTTRCRVHGSLGSAEPWRVRSWTR